jgi:hypothetical protein
MRYWRRVSASWRVVGGLNIYERQNASIKEGEKIGEGKEDEQYLVKRKSWISRNREIRIQRNILYLLLRFPRAIIQPHLPQTLTHPQNPINQQPIRRSLDLEIPKEGVGAKEREDLVERIVGFVVGCWGLICWEGGGGEGVCWSADPCAEGEEREVPDYGGGFGGGVIEDTVVCLGGCVSLGEFEGGGGEIGIEGRGIEREGGTCRHSDLLKNCSWSWREVRLEGVGDCSGV